MNRVKKEIQGCRPALGSSRCNQGERRQAFPKRVIPVVQSMNIEVILREGHLEIPRPIAWRVYRIKCDGSTIRDLPPIAQLHHAVVARKHKKLCIQWPEEWSIPATELRERISLISDFKLRRRSTSQ